jgi:hypothetical protein
MPSISDVQAVLTTLRTATTYAAVFGPMRTGEPSAQKDALAKQFRRLAAYVHPDVAPADAAALAQETFTLLCEMRKSADSAIEHGTYGTAFKAQNPPEPVRKGSDDGQVLQSASAVYRLDGHPYRTGDFSVLYRAQTLTDGNKEVLIKIASDPTYNALVERELGLLRKFATAPAKDPLARLAKYVPTVTDTFMVGGAAGTKYRATVMVPHGEALSLTDIRQALGAPLEPPEAAWVIRRVVAQTLAADMLGVVHGAIVPDHVLVDPILHEPCHIGWLHAVDRKNKERITMVLDRWRDWYPPEVLSKKAPDHRTDLYMAGKTMVWLLGGDTKTNTLPATVPKAMAACILQCVAAEPARRPKDGRVVLDDLTTIIRKEWGRQYRPLILPSAPGAGTKR